MRSLTFALVTIAIAGCGSNTTTGPDMNVGSSDMSIGPDMEKFSACGHPGDKGNAKGIGQYCLDSTTCPPPLLCSTIENGTLPANQQTFFCTTTCPTAGPDPVKCGDNATCSCQGPTCACVPNACLTAGMSG